jgi:hypothetical protein
VVCLSGSLWIFEESLWIGQAASRVPEHVAARHSQLRPLKTLLASGITTYGCNDRRWRHPGLIVWVVETQPSIRPDTLRRRSASNLKYEIDREAPHQALGCGFELIHIDDFTAHCSPADRSAVKTTCRFAHHHLTTCRLNNVLCPYPPSPCRHHIMLQFPIRRPNYPSRSFWSHTVLPCSLQRHSIHFSVLPGKARSRLPHSANGCPKIVYMPKPMLTSLAL